MRAGYKMTKLGEIPLDWEVKELGELSNFRRGSFPQPYGLDKWYDDINGYPFVQVYDVGNRFKLKDTTKRKISYEAAKQSVLVEKGTLIITIQGSIGRMAITQYEAYVDRTLLIFQSFVKSIDKHYFMYIVFQLFETEKKKAHGSTIKTITKQQLSHFEIPLPPLQEQKKIAQILSTVDEKIDLTQRKIETTQALKKGLMQQLLTKGIGHTEFKESKLGEIPLDWEVVKLGSILELGSGKDYKHLNKGSYPVYGTGGYMTSVDDFLHEGESVGIGRKGTIDKPVFLTGRFWTVDTLFYTHSFNNTTPYFVYILFQSINWRKHNEATGVPSLSKIIINSIKVLLPPLQEQKKIAEILSKVDEKIDLLVEKKKAYQAMKKGLMQQLLTGQVRVG